MQWVKQPDGSNLCGQVAVAVVAGISLEKSIELFGKKGCTRTKDVVRVLRQLGFHCPDRLSRKFPLQKVKIAKLCYPNSNRSHWVVYNENKIYDGINGDKDGNVIWGPKWRITSYLPISKMQL